MAERSVRPPSLGLRVRDALSSPNAQAAAVLVALLSLLLAAYVIVAQINLTNCLARYNEAAATSTAARAAAAAEDRATDLTERQLNEIERRRQALNDVALDKVLRAMADRAAGATGREEVAAAFRDLVAVRIESAVIRAGNDVQRIDLVRQRAATDSRRKAHPIPDPPSTMCGGESMHAAALFSFRRGSHG